MTSYEFVAVGTGTAGSVVAARLSENPDARVPLVEAGPATGLAIAQAAAAIIAGHDRVAKA
jgi:choline dehydrogenase-like flavoprotein